MLFLLDEQITPALTLEKLSLFGEWIHFHGSSIDPSLERGTVLVPKLIVGWHTPKKEPHGFWK